MPWGQIARFVVALIAPYLIDLGIRLTGIYNSIQGLAKEREPYNIEALVRNIYDDERNVNTGFPAILAEVKFISDDHENSLQTILNAIAALPAGSDIVIPSSGANAEAVWLYQNDYRDRMGNMLSKLDETNFKLGPIAGHLMPGTSWFAFTYPTTFGD